MSYRNTNIGLALSRIDNTLLLPVRCSASTTS